MNRNRENCSPDKKNILEITYYDTGKIRLSLSESQGQGPLTFYQETEAAIERIDVLVREINHYLNKINLLKNQDAYLLSELQKSCQLLYNELLSREIKSRLQNTSFHNLEFILDEQLVHIPWELLYDGQKFFCEQFNIGRQVRTKGNILANLSSIPETKFPLKMLIIADPTEDLEVAWEEGVKIYEEFQQNRDLINITLQSADQVDLDFVKKNLWDYDLVHYAGHADYDPIQPEQSGWMLSDGKLRAEDIAKMAGAKRVMPRLIFSNACQSGYTEKWENQNTAEDTAESTHQSYGLVHAFLMTGVHYYIGTFCDVSDEYGAYMGVEFYRYLLKGNTIGESLRLAKESFREKFRGESSSWINYVLYGHPGDYFIGPEKNDALQEKNVPVSPRKVTHDTSRSKPAGEPLTHHSSKAGITQAKTSLRHSRFFPQRKKWMGTVIIILLFLFFTALAVFFPGKRVKNQAKQNDSIAFAARKQERIKELKEMIYAKLKARGKKADSSWAKEASPDSWTSKPLVIAVFSIFEQEANHPLPDWAFRIIKDLDTKLTECFVEDASIRVAERKELDMLLEEKDLELADFSFGDQKDLFARFLYARVMLFLKAYQSSEGLSLCYKVVDAETGEIDKINSDFRLSKKQNLKNLVTAIYTQARKEIYAKYPLRGKIAALRDNLVILNIGAAAGVGKGDVFDVFGPYNQGFARKRIGKIRAVHEVMDQTQAHCEILEGGQFKEGLRVEVAGR